MATENPVFNILATSGNLAPLAAGSKPEALAIGQIGVFDYHTSLSVNGTETPLPNDIFLAVGVDRNADTVTDNIERSAGQMIQVRNMKSWTTKAYLAEIQQVVTIAITDVLCDTDYGIKIIIQNQDSYRVNGYTQASKTFTWHTPCCVGVATAGVVADVVNGLVAAINADPEGLFIAAAVGGTTVRITGVAQVRPSFGCGINVKYYMAGTHFTAVPVLGFQECGTTPAVVTVVTPNQYPQGSGYDLKQLEYQANGWKEGGPYRTYGVTGLAKEGTFLIGSGNYNIMDLTYDEFSVGGWLEYLNNLETIIAMPCADTATLIGLVDILDLIFTQFAPQTDDVAGMDCTNTTVNLINNVTLDGIESLA